MKLSVQYYFLLILYCFSLQAQDVVFSQYFNAPLKLNPAYTGNTFSNRINIIYRSQWLGLGPTYQSVALSGDGFIESMNIGLGGNICYDSEGKGIYNTTSANVNTSYIMNANDQLFIAGGISLGFISKQLKKNLLVFESDINPSNGTVNQTANAIINKSSTFSPDFGAGILLFNADFYAGIAVHHLYTNEAVFLSKKFRLPMRYNFNAGYQFRMNGNIKSITPMILYENQNPFQQINIGAIASAKKIYLGLSYRNVIANSDALIFHLGYKNNILGLGYSYDITMGQLMRYGYGTHELGITIDFSKSEKYLKSKRGRKYLDCFKMFK